MMSGLRITSDLEYYGEENRSILIGTEINEDVANQAIAELLALDKISDDPIVVHINTPGGSVLDTLAIYDIMRAVDSPIVTYAMGACMSGGLILISGGDLRLSLPNTMFFYHEPVTMSMSQTFHNMEQSYQQYRHSLETMNNIIKSKTNIPENIWNHHFKGRDSCYFTALQAKEWGFIDDIMEPNPKKKKIELLKEPPRDRLSITPERVKEIKESNGLKRKGRS